MPQLVSNVFNASLVLILDFSAVRVACLHVCVAFVSSVLMVSLVLLL